MGVTSASLVLASQSPRRRELLLAAGIPHAVRVAVVDEATRENESPVAYVRRVARDKALAVARLPGEIVLAADTTVVCAGQILGKPAHDEDARRMLRLLSGKGHEVVTGICLRHDSLIRIEHEITKVWFAALSESQIDDYIQSGEPMDKAGGYAIQGIASRYIDRIEGSYSNVVGLPVALVWRELEALRSSPS